MPSSERCWRRVLLNIPGRGSEEVHTKTNIGARILRVEDGWWTEYWLPFCPCIQELRISSTRKKVRTRRVWVSFGTDTNLRRKPKCSENITPFKQQSFFSSFMAVLLRETHIPSRRFEGQYFLFFSPRWFKKCKRKQTSQKHSFLVLKEIQSSSFVVRYLRIQ